MLSITLWSVLFYNHIQTYYDSLITSKVLTLAMHFRIIAS